MLANDGRTSAWSEPGRGDGEPNGRAAEAARVASAVWRRREGGDWVADDDVVARHAELMPELGDEMSASREIRRALLAARCAGAIDEPLAVLPPTALDAPLDLGDPADDPADDRRERRCEIDGYVLLREVGRGGQGVVFRAVQESTGRRVAVKLLAGGPLAGSRHRARFELEAAALAGIDHPGIVRIVDRGRASDGSFFLAMDYVEGEDLDEFWTATVGAGPGQLARLLRAFAAVAEAVDAAHEAGVVHRDLKPSNVRVNARGEPCLLDFGLSARAGAEGGGAGASSRRLTSDGQTVGTLPWSSPEQLDGGPVDLRADVYAIGVMLYQGLAGRFPYPTDGPLAEVVRHIRSTAPRPPGRCRGPRSRYVSRKLDDAVLRALAKSAKDRYATAGALARDLRSLAEGRSPAGVASRRRARATSAVAVAAALSVVLSAAGTGLEAWRRGRYASIPYTVYPLPERTNTVGIRFRRIPGGEFLRGSALAERGREPDEQQEPVRLTRQFDLGVTEVTAAQYASVMGLPTPDADAGGLPALNVSWFDAQEFCRRLGAREGRAYRLPTDAEWEWACRAGTSVAYAGTGVLGEMGWYDDNAAGRPHPVGQKSPNVWGLYDMHGNAAEWCADGYAPLTADHLLIDPEGEARASDRVVRGGSFALVATRCRSASREGRDPGTPWPDVGFRVAADAP